MTVDVLHTEKTPNSRLTRVFEADMGENRYSMDGPEAAPAPDEAVHTHILVNLGAAPSRLHYTSLAAPQPYAILLPNFKPCRRLTHPCPPHGAAGALHAGVSPARASTQRRTGKNLPKKSECLRTRHQPPIDSRTYWPNFLLTQRHFGVVASFSITSW